MRGSEAEGISSAPPPISLGQSAERLRILVPLYAFAFCLASIFPMLLVPADRAARTQDRARDWWAAHPLAPIP